LKIFILPYSKSNPYQDELAKNLRLSGIDVCFAPANGSLWSAFKNFRLQGDKETIIHLHWTHVYFLANTMPVCLYKAASFFLFIIRAKRAGAKLVWTVHNLGEHEKLHPDFELYCHRRLASHCDRLIVHSEYAKKAVTSQYRLTGEVAKVCVVPHGNYIDVYPNAVSGEQARRQLGLSDNAKVFLFLGQIRSYKGIPQLLEAFVKINDPAAVLIIAGRPNTQEVQEQLIALVGGKNNIRTFFEYIPKDQIQIYVNAADAVVLPFQEIFTSGSLLLAMSFGKAVILPALKCFAELTDSHGFVSYSPDQKDGLYAAMKKAFELDLDAMGAHNLQKIRIYNWHKVAEKTVEVYRAALSTKKPSLN
jgi:glycosyltransferase involved in cell wall biosynthesis